MNNEQWGMGKGLLIFLVIIGVFMPVRGGAQDVDSLYNRYKEGGGGRRVTLANEIAQAVFELECTDSLILIEGNAEPEYVGAIVNELMSAYADFILNDLTKAISFALDAAQLYEQSNDILAMDKNYSDAAIYYFRMGDYANAIDLMLKCYELEKQLNDPHALSTTLNNLGIAYSNWGNRKEAIEYFRKAVDIERPLNRPLQYAGRLSSLAKETSLLGNHKEAIALIKEALDYDRQLEGIQREDRIAAHHIIMGDIFVEADSLQQAETCYQYAISIFEKINRQQLLASSLLGLGRMQLLQQRFVDAIETLNYCLEISEKNRLQRILLEANRFLYEGYKQTGNATQALIYHEHYRNLTDSIFKETIQNQLSELQIKNQTAEKELQIERQQAEIVEHRTRQYILIGSLLAVCLMLVMLIYIVMLRTRRNRELAEMNAIKDKFFSIISHDLKNPAVAQRDAIQLLLENPGKWDTEALTGYYQKLHNSADGLVDLLKNLLNWAQIQTGRKSYNPIPFNLVAALQPDINLIKSMAERKGVRFDAQMPPSAVVTGDRNMITTVVRNLMSNAVKFTAEGGTVTLDISAGKDAPGIYAVSVADTGTGMTSEQMQNLFLIDRQRSHEGTAGEQGTGLGLIVCKELIEKHNRTLQVESEPGKGSRFRFELSQ